MKRHAALFLCLAVCAGLPFLVACSSQDDSPVGATRGESTENQLGMGLLVVQVYFDEGIPDKKLELVELGMVRTTNAAGFAKFVVPAREYTLRAYEINHGGPMLLYIDMPVTVKAGEPTRIRIFDCIPCD